MAPASGAWARGCPPTLAVSLPGPRLAQGLPPPMMMILPAALWYPASPHGARGQRGSSGSWSRGQQAARAPPWVPTSSGARRALFPHPATPASPGAPPLPLLCGYETKYSTIRGHLQLPGKRPPFPIFYLGQKPERGSSPCRRCLQEVTTWQPSWGPVSYSCDLFPGPARFSTTAAPPLGSEPCKL